VVTTETTQGIEVKLRGAQRLERWAALAAAYVGGGLTAAAVMGSYALAPLPVALDIARAAVILLVALAVIAGLIRRAVAVTLRGQREIMRELAVRSVAVELAAVTAEVARLRGQTGIELRELVEAVQRVEARLTADIAEAYRLGAESTR
jgi:hypothetical protein